MFELEKSICAWKRNLRRQETFEDGMIADLEIHLRDIIDALKSEGISEDEAFRMAAARVGGAESLAAECGKVRAYRLDLRSPLRPARFMPALLGNYLKVVLRRIRRQKGYSFINIAGLAVGLAAAVIIFLWAQDELGYDQFHVNAGRIGLAYLKPDWASGYNEYGPGALGPALAADYPEIAAACRTFSTSSALRYDGKAFNGRLIGVDPSFFQMFSFPFVQGGEGSPLSDPNSIVLTDGMARKFFGSDTAVGKTLGFEWVGTWHDFKVAGVVENVPLNSSLQFDYLLPFNFVTRSGMDIEKWDGHAYPTYVLLRGASDWADVNRKIAGIMKRYLPESRDTVILQPFARLHLHRMEGGGLIVSVRLFILIGLFILALAWVNFMNLATAQATGRAREVGLRKVVGSSRSNLVRRFLGESLIFSFFALLLSLGFVAAVLPAINRIVGKSLSLRFSVVQAAVLVGLAILTGLVSGFYPAFYLSGFRPVRVIRGPFASGRRSARFRGALVVGQFVISIVLVIGTTTVYKQLTYMKNKDLGYEKACVLNIELRGGLRNNYRAIRAKLLENPDVLAVSATNGSFGKRFATDKARWEGQNPGEKTVLAIHAVDYDYQKIFDLKMADGRYFSRKFPTDMTDAIVLNETAAKLLGTGSPLGKSVYVPLPFDVSKDRKVIGVAKDYHFRSLHEKIEPLVLVVAPGWFTDSYIRIKPGRLPETLDYVEKTLKELAPGYPFVFSFLDEEIDRLYKTEMRIGALAKYCTAIALFIAGLGLFGLASFTAQQKTKEIGIRKVLGASVPGLSLLLTKEFTKWVLAANFLAWPVAYLVVRKWLEGFAYRTPFGPGLFLFAGALVGVVAWLAVGYQTIKAASADPVRSLRYE
jgi:putative ABC transport system permease protein